MKSGTMDLSSQPTRPFPGEVDVSYSPNIRPTVYLIDDDESALRSLAALVDSMGIPNQSFLSAEDFLLAYDGISPGCVVTDVRMTGLSGLELQQHLAARGWTLPVIVITAFASTPLTVQAMQQGAVTLLEKPCHDQLIWDAIRAALARDSKEHLTRLRKREWRERAEQLTPEEREVMDLILQGHPNKAIAAQLDVSLRTVEARRHNIFAKTKTNSVAELVRLVMQIETL